MIAARISRVLIVISPSPSARARPGGGSVPQPHRESNSKRAKAPQKGGWTFLREDSFHDLELATFAVGQLAKMTKEFRANYQKRWYGELVGVS
jgi:hypothetical protein